MNRTLIALLIILAVATIAGMVIRVWQLIG